MADNGRKACNLPTDWSDEQRRDYARYLAYRITKDEQALLNKLVKAFKRAMKSGFGERADIVWTSFIGSQLGHLLLSRDGFHVFSVINDWLDTTHRQHGGRHFQLEYGMSTEPSGETDEHAAH